MSNFYVMKNFTTVTTHNALNAMNSFEADFKRTLPAPYIPYYLDKKSFRFNLKPNNKRFNKYNSPKKFYLTPYFPKYFKKVVKTKENKKGEKRKIVYSFESNTPEFNYYYGLSPKDKLDVDYKLKKQQLFLDNTFLLFGENENKLPLSKMVMTPNLTPHKYYGEMYNRVNALKESAKDLGFDTPIFCTVTPRTEFKPLKQDKRGDYIRMVDNPNFNSDSNYVKNAMDDLSTRFSSFRQSRVFKEIRAKYNSSPVYMRTVEPTIDGVPHIHFVIYVPSEFKDRVMKFMNSTLGKHSMINIKHEFKNGEDGVIRYILKYILKTFANAKTKELTSTGYWFAKHKIRRFTTSRTLAPLYLFRKIRHREEYQDYREVTKLYNQNTIMVDFYEKQKVEYMNEKTGEVINLHSFLEIANNVNRENGYIHHATNEKISFEDYQALKRKNGFNPVVPEHTLGFKPLISFTPKRVDTIYRVVSYSMPDHTNGETDITISEVDNLYEKNFSVKIIQKVELLDKDDNKLCSMNVGDLVKDFDLLFDDTKWRYIEKADNHFKYEHQDPLNIRNLQYLKYRPKFKTYELKFKEDYLKVNPLKPQNPLDYIFNEAHKVKNMFPTNSAPRPKHNSYDVIIDDISYISIDEQLIQVNPLTSPAPCKRGDMDLLQTYRTLPNDIDPNLYLTYRNECIRRELIEGKICSYGDYIYIEEMNLF